MNTMPGFRSKAFGDKGDLPVFLASRSQVGGATNLRAIRRIARFPSMVIWQTIGVVLLSSAIVVAHDIKVETDFPGGSGEVAKIDQASRIVQINPTDHRDRGWACWWYVRLTGINPGETITLDVGEAPWATPDRAAFSLDDKSWSQTAAGRRKGRRISYRQKVNARECWFAWGPPFVPEDAQVLVDEAAGRCAFARAFELCATRAGRSVPALVVNQNEGNGERYGIWIQARQHAWESGSSWVCSGFVRWITSGDPRAEALRRNSRITIVPIMDIDNTAIGAGGKSQKPQDHNRDWSDTPHWNSVRAAMEHIKRMDQDGAMDLFVDLHNPSARDLDPYFYITPRETLSVTGVDNLNRFLATSQLEITGPLAYKGRAVPSGARYDKNWKRISKNWVKANTHEHVVAVTLETAWNTPHSNIQGYQTVGRHLGQTIERFFRVAAQH